MDTLSCLCSCCLDLFLDFSNGSTQIQIPCDLWSSSDQVGVKGYSYDEESQWVLEI